MRAARALAAGYPRGESYYDIIERLDPMVIEMLKFDEPLLIVSHQATLRLVRGFLMGVPRNECPAYEIPLHTVMKITWDGWSKAVQEAIPLGPPKEQVLKEVQDFLEANRAVSIS
jgi:broad specificity phosphatase PhoE